MNQPPLSPRQPFDPGQPFDLRRFENRLRLGRAFRYGFLAATFASIAATIWAILDLFGLVIAHASQFAIWIGSWALMGAIAGAVWRISSEDLAKSVDRRAGLGDRLSSAIGAHDSAFTTDLKADAAEKLSAVKAASVFPIKFGRKHLGMAFSFTLPFAIFLISYNHLLLNPTARAEREEMKASAPTIEHILAPLAKDPALSSDEQALAKQLKRFQQQLERGNLDKTEAQALANKLSQDAERLMHEKNEETLKNLDSAEQALDQMKKSSLEKEGAADPELQNLKGEKLDQKLQELAAKAPTEHQLTDLQKRIDDLTKQLSKPGLSPHEQKDLQKQLSDAQKQMQQLKLSDAVKKMLDRLQKNPAYAELQKMLQKMRSGAQQSQGTKQAPLTKEQIEEMQKKLEELAEQLKDDKAMTEYIKKLEEALKQAKKSGTCSNISLGVEGLMSLPMGGAPSTAEGPRSGAPLNMSDKEAAGQGKTHEVAIRGDQRDSEEPTPYVEQRGMAKLTGPSSIPLLRATPASKLKAEQAVNRQNVPKEHRERVKKYFEALEGK